MTARHARGRRSWRLLMLVLVVLLGPTPGWAQPHFGAPHAYYFRLEWRPEISKTGTPSVHGYVYNEHGYPAARMKLLVEGLDGAGQPLTWTIGYVDGLVPAKSRAFFEVRNLSAASSYRVTVHSFEWIVGNGDRTRRFP